MNQWTSRRGFGPKPEPQQKLETKNLNELVPWRKPDRVIQLNDLVVNLPWQPELPKQHTVLNVRSLVIAMHWENLPSLKDKCAKQLYQAKGPDYGLPTWNHQFALLEWPNNPRGIWFWALCPWPCLLWHWHWSKVSVRTKRGWEDADEYRNETWFSLTRG